MEWNLKSSHLASSLLNCGHHFSALRSSSRAISALLNYSHDSSQPLLSLKFFHLSPPLLNSSHLFSTLPNDSHLTHLFQSLLNLCQLFSTPLISSRLFSTHFIYSHLLSTLLSSSPILLSSSQPCFFEFCSTHPRLFSALLNLLIFSTVLNPFFPVSLSLCLDFTQRSFYTRMPLHTDTFTHRNFYTEKLLHTEAFTQKSFYTQKFIQGSFYTKKLLHREVFAHRSLYTELVRRETFTQRSFYKEVSTHKSFYAEKFLHKGQTFCTEKPSRTKRQQKLQLQKGISAPKGKK